MGYDVRKSGHMRTITEVASAPPTRPATAAANAIIGAARKAGDRGAKR